MLKHLINNIIMHKSKQISFSVASSFLFLLLFSISGASTYYVNVSGRDSNSGLTEKSDWKTINYASEMALPGDTVFIKAGIYKDEKLIVAHTGNAESPIVFQGYQSIPGDNPTIDYQPGDSLDSTIMPLMDGLDRTSGRAIVASYRSYIEIRNIQITHYELGVYIPNSSHVLIENVIAAELGDIDDFYSGVGFKIYKGGSNIFKNCIVMNAAAEGIGIVSSDSNLLENCKSYCDDATNVNSGTDYYLYIYGNYNTVRDCYIERIGNLEHVGHGMTVKGFGEHNLFENCVARNFKGGGFVVRHRGVKYNVFMNCTAYGATGFLIRDGASYNNFYDCKAIDCFGAVRFEDSDEDDGAQYAGRYNNFYNCLFKNFGYFINFNSYDGQYSKGGENNRFINCVIDDGQVLYRCDRENKNNELINSIVSNVGAYRIGNYDISMSYTNSDFWNNEFDTPSGSNILAIDPLFSDAANGDYSLQANSPCIEAGVTDTSGLFLPLFDADGNSRISDGNGDAVATIDIGAFEYIGSAGGNILPIANAGADQTVVDNDGDGSEDISLDGSASSDSDGTIVSYIWKEGETQIATGVTPTVNLSVATHTITLTVTDNKGGAKSDNVIITVQAKADTVNPGNFALRFNSETKKDDFLLIENIPISSIYTIEFWVKLENSTNDTDALIWMGGDGQRLTLRNNHKPTWGGKFECNGS